MRKRRIKVSLIAGLALLLALPAFAHSQRTMAERARIAAAQQRGAEAPRGRVAEARRRAGRARMSGRGERLGLATRALAHAEDIGLSTEQREQILAEQRLAREASINRRAALRIAELQLRDLVSVDDRDIAAIEAKLREIAEQRIAAQISVFRLDDAVNGVLTNEQREALDDLPRDRGPRGRLDRSRVPRRAPR
jgi:Spy/CpxP family protein refolding chaperone